MPFTFSHVAILYPLQKLRLRVSVTALAAGAMVPDLENFLQMRHVRGIGHHWIGVVFLDLPAGLFLCLLFHNLLKCPAFQMLPLNYQQRFFPFLRRDWNAYFRQHPFTVVVSLLVGIVSHLLWDGFTHSDGMFVPYISLLEYNLPVFGIRLPVHLWLQILTSLGGLWLVFRMLKKVPVNLDIPLPVDLDRKTYLQAVVLSFVLIFGLRIWLMPQSNTYLSLVKGSIGAGFYAWVVGSLIVRTGQPIPDPED